MTRRMGRSGVDIRADATTGAARRARRAHRRRLALEDLEGRVAPAGLLFAVPAGSSSIAELDPATAAVRNSIAAPEPAGTGAAGLAFDGEHLFYLHGLAADTLYELDPDTGAVLDSDALPATEEIAGLAYLGGRVYVQVHPTDAILVFDPVTDTVVRTLSPGVDLVGGLTGASALGLLFGSNGAGTLFAIDPATGAVSTRSTPASAS